MRYLEDFVVGERLLLGEHLLTVEEIRGFALLWDPQPFHIDEEAARSSIFGGLVASGVHLVALTIKMITASDARAQVLAAAGWESVRFPAPARAGDSLSLAVECVEARPSRSKPDRGVVKNHFTLTNQSGELVLDYTDIILVARRRSG